MAPEYVAAFQKTRTGSLVRVELANQSGWKVGDHIPRADRLSFRLALARNAANHFRFWRRLRVSVCLRVKSHPTRGANIPQVLQTVRDC
jgi:hypothetical protein